MPGPNWLRHRLGDEYFVCVAEAFFDKASHRVLDDAMFVEFADELRSRNLPRPSGLVFSDLPISDATLMQFDVFPDIISIHFFSCPSVTDAGLQYIKPLGKLRRLNLRGTSITDNGLVNLSGLKELRELSLMGTVISDAGLVHLEDLTNLNWLDLSDTSVTNNGVKKLKAHLPNCEISW